MSYKNVMSTALAGLLAASMGIAAWADAPKYKMTTEVRVPTLGESVTEATVATWFKKPGDTVAVDEMLCELETDKVTVEVGPLPQMALAKKAQAEQTQRRLTHLRASSPRRSSLTGHPR